MYQNGQPVPYPNYPGSQTNQPQAVSPGGQMAVCAPPDFATHMNDMSRRLENQAAIIECQRNQLARQELREQAYASFFANNGQTYVKGRNGDPLTLMDDVIIEAFYYYSSFPLYGKPFYLLKTGKHGFVRIDEKNFYSDKYLINSFQQQGIRVYKRGSQKNTAFLLRQAINDNFTQRSLLFYGGWLTDSEKHTDCYFVFSPFLSCNPKGEVTEPTPLLVNSQAVLATAVNQFLLVFEIIRNPLLRQMVLLLYHEAALHTLLEHFGYPFSLSYCIFSAKQDVLSYFRVLLSWFSSGPLTLDTPVNDFSYGLLSCKDQPLLIEDRGRLDHAAKNAQVLESAMLNGVVEWKRGRKAYSLPVAASIALLSSHASALNCSSEVLVLDIHSSDFDRERWLKLAEQVGNNQDYLTAFCGYTSIHTHKLQEALAKGLETARCLDGGELTEECLRAFGIFIGLHEFLNNFFKCASPDLSPFALPDEELFCEILSLLVRTAAQVDSTDMPKKFVEISRRLIQTGTLHTCRTNQCPEDISDVVFYDTNKLHFTPSAFFIVCQSMMQSRPTILSALSDANLLCGARTNKTTEQTRITVWTEQGASKSLSVYSLLRDGFDVWGDPLILEGEDA